jgi:hypothetical protein
MDNEKNKEMQDFEPDEIEKTPDKAEGDVETVDESIRIHEAKGDLKVAKPKTTRKKATKTRAA